MNKISIKFQNKIINPHLKNKATNKTNLKKQKIKVLKCKLKLMIKIMKNLKTQ